MDSKEIQKRVDGIVDDMIARGLRNPVASADFNGKEDPYIYMKWGQDGAPNGISEFARGETIEECFKMADAIIEAIPPKADRDRAEFTRMLAQVIDKGNDIGIEVDMLNPLQAMMQKLSENAITYQTKTVELGRTPATPYGFDENDPMPF